VVEYEALVNGLYITTELGVRWLYIRKESELVVNQVLGESNYRDSCMVVYQQEIRKLEEKINGIELHLLRRYNKVVDALAWLWSSHKMAPLGVFAQDLFKPSIWIKEDISIPTSRTSPGEDNPVPALGAPSGKDSSAPTFEVNTGASTGPIKPNLGPEGIIVVVIEPSNPEADW
jgi:hypothetical protein